MAVSERLDIYLRAHTAEVQKPPESPRITAKPAQWPDHVLLFDTETRTSIDQSFIFGIYRICKLMDGHYRCSEEGIFYDKLSTPELNAVRSFAKNTFSDIEVPSFPPNVRFSVHGSLLEFMERVFFPALREGWLIAGFNLPFDLSRLSLDWRKTRKGGFTLILSKSGGEKRKAGLRTPIVHPLRSSRKMRELHSFHAVLQNVRQNGRTRADCRTSVHCCSRFSITAAVCATGAVTSTKRENLDGCTKSWIT